MDTPIEDDKWFPSTKTCPRCGSIRDIGLDERIYVCPVCGLVMDRDLNSSHTLEQKGLQHVVPTGCRDGMPVETESSTVTSLEYLKGIPMLPKVRLEKQDAHCCSVGSLPE